MQQLMSILLFYRPFIIWSLVINMLFAFLKFEVGIIMASKLLLVLLLWHILNETQAKRKLIFYRKLGVSTIKLFTLLFIMDLAISIPFLIILKEFV